jgi:large subunit ribosomal protein L32
MRHTRGHTGNRRSHHALKQINLIKDTETGSLRLPHRLDETTGMYRGKQIAPAKAARVSKKKLKGASTEPKGEHTHEHAHAEHANAAIKAAESGTGKVKREARSEVKTGGRPKARSGMGGQAS